ncbi:L-idonate 5-dehydrogenase [Sinomonas cellulolyticus]|uniref:L-idonate 5-dehydrogenase n=1 Tax=Sinomonas cellulolyticus TaxID=2801916 RepID=A0ABS1JXU6_9MICC|nr:MULTISPECIES: L-idonate 5-dehydrogenase [Sinomonas]MBL0703998.1 L-idonate 5-dehydrogenase [Sinomonas cellulolyticus]GHG59106.1 L-idonate 5-dehydrogenase [Sinomonas sp. KCTC 49339]
MKSVVLHGADDLRIETGSDPAPGPGEVLVSGAYGGICGSDLHYWRHGRNGAFDVVEPLVLGHEFSGRILELGAGVDGVDPGQLITVHPATHCGRCRSCLSGARHLCENGSYAGSAAVIPHRAGLFSTVQVVRADQIRRLPAAVSPQHAAVIEPLAVAVHAVRRAGGVDGRSVLVNGAGPIGALAVAAAKAEGAQTVYASDLSASALAIAANMGADETINLAQGQQLPYDVDVVIEASGAAAALGGCLSSARRGGTVVQVGNLPGGPIQAELAALVGREINYVGAFRFDHEMTDAADMIAAGLDVSPVVTHTFGLDDALGAFKTAADKNISSKVLLDLHPTQDRSTVA